jgi:hypothetical protein
VTLHVGDRALGGGVDLLDFGGQHRRVLRRARFERNDPVAESRDHIGQIDRIAVPERDGGAEDAVELAETLDEEAVFEGNGRHTDRANREEYLQQENNRNRQC